MNVKLIIAAVIATIIAGMSFVIYRLDSKVTTLTEDKAKLETTIEYQQSTINVMQDNMEQLARANKDYQQKNSALDDQFRKTSEQLANMKNRQPTVYAKPELVQKQIQMSYSKFADKISCTSGAKDKC